jgi:hypothetical protein
LGRWWLGPWLGGWLVGVLGQSLRRIPGLRANPGSGGGGRKVEMGARMRRWPGQAASLGSAFVGGVGGQSPSSGEMRRVRGLIVPAQSAREAPQGSQYSLWPGLVTTPTVRAPMERAPATGSGTGPRLRGASKPPGYARGRPTASVALGELGRAGLQPLRSRPTWSPTSRPLGAIAG